MPREDEYSSSFTDVAMNETLQMWMMLRGGPVQSLLSNLLWPHKNPVQQWGAFPVVQVRMETPPLVLYIPALEIAELLPNQMQ